MPTHVSDCLGRRRIRRHGGVPRVNDVRQGRPAKNAGGYGVSFDHGCVQVTIGRPPARI